MSRHVSTPGQNFTVHELKSWPVFYRPVADRIKTYEVRKNDRGFKVHDRLWLREFDPKEKTFTGESLVAEVTHILRAHEGLQRDFVCMAIVVL